MISVKMLLSFFYYQNPHASARVKQKIKPEEENPNNICNESNTNKIEIKISHSNKPIYNNSMYHNNRV